MEQLAGRTRLLRNIDAPHVHENRECFLSKGFPYSCGMLTAAVAHYMKPEVNSCGEMVRVSTGNRFLRSGLYVGVVDGCERFQVSQERLEQSSNTSIKGNRNWLSKPLGQSVIHGKAGVQFSTFETMELSSQSNLTRGIV